MNTASAATLPTTFSRSSPVSSLAGTITANPKCEKDALHHRAWNIYTALRYQMAWHDRPEGGWGLHFDKPYPWGGEPVAECRIEEGQSLVDVRKHGEEELSEMEQSNGCN